MQETLPNDKKLQKDDIVAVGGDDYKGMMARIIRVENKKAYVLLENGKNVWLSLKNLTRVLKSQEYGT